MSKTTKYPQGPLLSKINSPDDLRKLNKNQLEQISTELRQYIVDIVSEKGGHFGASLGVVELTVALHYVFNTPIDQLVWDVGHQAYGHKILTGRKEQFPTNRIYKGLSGFPKRSESVYDTFGVGHSSTSISAALGMAMASKSNGDNKKQHIAVIGDGSMTAGMAFEALNHAGAENSNLLVILNDNCMSIDPAVGALKEYLTDISTSKTYNKAKNKIWKILGKISKFGPNAQAVAKKVEGAVKSTLLGESNYFESLNFRYFGPIDGHETKHLVNVLNDLKDIPGPKILHCLTVKGKGYSPAEQGDTTKWHAPGLFNKDTGDFIVGKKKKSPPKYQDVFGETIIELAKKNEQIVGVTPAMLTGSSLNKMMAEMPERTYDVGIAEQHAVTFSAGLATQGKVPFCNIYSSFMQRAYDQVIHDVALQNLNVVFCLDRGGLVGADGATHHGAYDIAFFRCIPNMIVSAPMNEQELRNLMYTAQLPNQGPFSIRYPRGKGVMIDWKTPLQEIEIGKGRMIKEGGEIAILSFGHPGNFVVKAQEQFEKEGLNIAHYDLRFAKPLDEKLLHSIFQKFNKIITIEDGCLQGGFGSSILEFMANNDYQASVKMLGIPDAFIHHGTQEELYNDCNYDTEAIIKYVHQILEKSLVSQVG
ncbi:MAG: 1-deoxy-D-xylulose-5-phosphate synthase [Flavobacteriales bacterium]|jgi:1-deoxy-D-xylulose-5-phosphate synthase|nr:1-deoxy-D-xylulose-5-phosphate synthase [Flavobacteriales bacterium]|tara:strand:- start:1290 stop:3227 length:1938 start_codon:yes stop_codon:yes gene_type:complete